MLGTRRKFLHIYIMAEEVIDLNRERFYRIDAKLDRILNAIEQLTLRAGSLEQKTALVVTDIARIDSRLDVFDRSLSRIETRLDLVSA